MFVVCVTFVPHSGSYGSFISLVTAQARNSLQKEANCLQFDVCFDEDGEVFLYEIYTDEAAFKDHLKSEHFVEFDINTKDLIQDKTVKTYRLANGKGTSS